MRFNISRIGWIHAVLCTLIVVMAVVLRANVLHVVAISSDCCAPQLLPGDHVAVLRQEWRDTVPQRGDIVTFTHTTTDSLFVGRITATPGDTLWIDDNGQLTDCRQAADHVIVPDKDLNLPIDIQNIRLYNQGINLHEPLKSAIVDNTLYVSGKPVNHYLFTQPYYWITATHPEQDSRTLGLIPASRITGTVLRVLYSHDPTQPLWSGWRHDRTAHPLHQ